MDRSRSSSSGVRPAGFFRRQKTTELFPEESSVPLLETTSDLSAEQGEALLDEEDRSKERKKKMGFFDNLRGWDRPKIYRYCILLALSLSGDGW